jgi:hypothetical protein
MKCKFAANIPKKQSNKLYSQIHFDETNCTIH